MYTTIIGFPLTLLIIPILLLYIIVSLRMIDGIFPSREIYYKRHINRKVCIIYTLTLGLPLVLVLAIAMLPIGSIIYGIVWFLEWLGFDIDDDPGRF